MFFNLFLCKQLQTKPENALEECGRFLKPLEEFASSSFETHTLAFEVYARKNKLMLMLRAVRKLKALTEKPSTTGSLLESTLAKFHYTLCKFLIKCTFIIKINFCCFSW